MKKQHLSRCLSLVLAAMLVLGMLLLTGCSTTNPAREHNLKTYTLDADGQPIYDTPAESEAPTEPIGTGETAPGETGESTETAPAETGEPAETTPEETGEPAEAPEEQEQTVQLVDLSECEPEVKMDVFDYVKLPFSYLLRWLYDLTSSYGWALILFALIVKIILLPASAKSKKGMMKMSRLTPKVKALEAKYGDDKQAYQQEVNKLYREEGAGGCGGCLWSFLPLLLLIPLYEIIREPITWLMFHGRASEYTLGQIQNVLLLAKNSADASEALKALKITDGYWQMQAIPAIKDCLPDLKAISEVIVPMNTKFLGVELATIPKVLFWNNTANGWWNAIGQFLLPLISGGMNLVSMWVSQKLNNTVIVNDKGQQDADMAKQNQTNKAMTFMMPLMSVYIGFVAPAGLSIYWIVQGLFSLVQDYFLTKHYKKYYDAEDAIKQEKAAKEAAEEAERERIRAEKRAENPDGMVGSASKKKLQQRQKQEQSAKEAAYQASKMDQAQREAELQAQLQREDSERPFRRGRNYDPNRYRNNDQEDTERSED